MVSRSYVRSRRPTREWMRICIPLVALFVVSLCAYGSVANAVEYKYAYRGAKMICSECRESYHSEIEEKRSGRRDKVLEAFRGYVVIDESLLPGGTLSNASFGWEYAYGNYWDHSNGGIVSRPLWLVDFDMNYRAHEPFADFNARFETNSEKEIVSWSLTFWSDWSPYDYYLLTFGDWLSYYGRIDEVRVEHVSRYPGQWNDVTAVPIPQALLPFLAGIALGVFGVLRRINSSPG